MLDVTARALDAAETAAGGAAGAAAGAATAPIAQLEAAEAAAGGPNGGGGCGGGGMEVDVPPLGAALAGALRGVVDHEPSAALKAAAGALLKRLP